MIVLYDNGHFTHSGACKRGGPTLNRRAGWRRCARPPRRLSIVGTLPVCFLLTPCHFHVYMPPQLLQIIFTQQITTHKRIGDLNKAGPTNCLCFYPLHRPQSDSILSLLSHPRFLVNTSDCQRPTVSKSCRPSQIQPSFHLD